MDKALFALKVVRRSSGTAAVVYRRQLDGKGRERFIRVAAISPLALSTGAGLLRSAARANGNPVKLVPGPFVRLDPDWGARVACYSLVARGLRSPERMSRAAEHFRHSDSAEAAWWFGILSRADDSRPVRALRILVEAVK